MNKMYQRKSFCVKNAGFTLIELLVVVLIIAILAAAALPRYQLAVEKSRAMAAVTGVKTWAEALNRYYMANGEYPLDENNGNQPLDSAWLDVTPPVLSGFEYYSHKGAYIAARRKHEKFYYAISKTLHTATDAGKRGLTCHTEHQSDANDFPARLCKMICGVDKLYVVWGSGQYGCEFR